MPRPTQDQIDAEVAKLEAADPWVNKLAILALRQRYTPGQLDTGYRTITEDEDEYNIALGAAKWAMGLSDTPPSQL